VKGGGTLPDLKIFAKTVEEEAVAQVVTLLEQEAFKDCKVRIMPDVHAGKGCVIGFTADLGDKVIPNIVGVDIGCGMLTVVLGKQTVDLNHLNEVIRAKVPFGRNVHEGRVVRFDAIQNLRCFRELKDTKRLERSIGTLGGGNHFIEIDQDEDGNSYLVIHTGSRNLGKQVADLYQNLAIDLMSGKDKLFEDEKQLIEEYKTAGRKSEIQSAMKELRRQFFALTPDVPNHLCYLTGTYREDYLHDMRIGQEFAVQNRATIAKIIIEAMGLSEIDRFETIHNYIDLDSNIVRKGAIRAAKGERLLIPINMRDGCIMGIGKGNDDWNQSAPHGAGRIMSRTKARETLSLDEYRQTMNRVFSTSVGEDTIDEAPMAYKPMDEIVEGIGDTVEIDRIIHPVYNFKASE
jgi:tRNA-splicing ligase RtcB